MKKMIASAILLGIVCIIVYTAYQMYVETTIKEKPAQENNISTEEQNVEENKAEQNIEEEEEVEEELQYLSLIPEEYKGYPVDAKLEIEKLNIDTYVLQEYSKPAMEVSIAKYFGPNPNEVGNYCIAGHNYIRKNMFSELGKLKVGESFTLTDNWHGAVEYEIYDKYKVVPTEVQALSQKTNGEKQVTLITCTDYSKKRIIIKARERIANEE